MRSIPVECLSEILDHAGQIDKLISECQPYSPDESAADEFIDDLESAIHGLDNRFKIMKKCVIEWRRIRETDQKSKWTPKIKKGAAKDS